MNEIHVSGSIRNKYNERTCVIFTDLTTINETPLLIVKSPPWLYTRPWKRTRVACDHSIGLFYNGKKINGKLLIKYGSRNYYLYNQYVIRPFEINHFTVKQNLTEVLWIHLFLRGPTFTRSYIFKSIGSSNLKWITFRELRFVTTPFLSIKL